MFWIGTRFDNEMGRWSPDTLLEIKRSDYVGGFLKIKYVGTFSGIKKELSVEHMELVDPQTYDEITNPPYKPLNPTGFDTRDFRKISCYRRCYLHSVSF